MIDRSILIALGIDDANYDEKTNFFSEMKIVALLQKGVNLDSGIITDEKNSRDVNN